MFLASLSIWTNNLYLTLVRTVGVSLALVVLLSAEANANQAPTVNAGPNQTLRQDQAANLFGTVSDDGLPAPGNLTFLWKKLSGPGTVTFGNSTALHTTASFQSPGVYKLRLKANDGALFDTDIIKITVTAPNQTPNVVAMPDFSHNFGSPATLNAGATDDGIPGPLILGWIQLSGPGEVQFGNQTTANASATFPQIGNYILRFFAFDGILMGFDDVAVSVYPENQLPIVNAGPDQTIQFGDPCYLQGLVTDDGLPNPPAQVRVTWSKISGPGNVSFANPNAAITTATFNAPGEYRLKLRADDDPTSPSNPLTNDNLTVTVNADPCFDPQKDESYFLNSTDGFDVELLPGPSGRPSFKATLNGTALRSIYPGELFYRDRSQGRLNISYSISEPECGGVDITYQISNPHPEPQRLPDFRVDGLRLAPSGEMAYLQTKDAGTLEPVDRSKPGEVYIDRDYPGLYIPAIVNTDELVSVGSAFHYPILEYKHKLPVRLQWVTSDDLDPSQANTWRHKYSTIAELMPSGETRSYKISVRFARPRHWLLTIAPYKQYFHSMYSAYSGPPADRRPVHKETIANQASVVTTENPRRYNENLGIHINGWEAYIDDLIGHLAQFGYERVHIWTPSGKYDDTATGFCSDCNYPPQFMDFEPLQAQTDQFFHEFAAHNIKFGFWWGRATEIPDPIDALWNPNAVIKADYHNPAHIQFLERQLQLALGRGAKEIGLDHYSSMAAWDRYYWTQDMLNLAPGVNFIHEASGGDIYHSLISNWYNPNRWGRYSQEGPDVLSHYLNPNAEIWVQQEYWLTTTPEIVQQLIRWGFTPVSQRFVPAQALDYTRVACMDGLDNDADGLKDFPYDPDCLSARDESETNAPEPACNNSLDDDGDGLKDFPEDPGCENSADQDESPMQFIVSASAGPGGSISPIGMLEDGQVLLDAGTYQIFDITPMPGYQISDVLVNGNSIGQATYYLFPNIHANHSIRATFSAIGGGQ